MWIKRQVTLQNGFTTGRKTTSLPTFATVDNKTLVRKNRSRYAGVDRYHCLTIENACVKMYTGDCPGFVRNSRPNNKRPVIINEILTSTSISVGKRKCFQAYSSLQSSFSGEIQVCHTHLLCVFKTTIRTKHSNTGSIPNYFLIGDVVQCSRL